MTNQDNNYEGTNSALRDFDNQINQQSEGSLGSKNLYLYCIKNSAERFKLLDLED